MRYLPVGDQLKFEPSNLTQPQFHQLSECAHAAENLSPQVLITTAKQHLERTRAAHASNRLINLRLATAIVSVLEELVNARGIMETNQAWWLRGAMYYFTTSNDDEPDFQSPLGFEDDAEILNACLKFIDRNDLCLNVEDYDNA
jgi:uncharacterized membrane protein YkvA (DUF1232 family)